MKALLRIGLTAVTIGLAISSAHALPVCAPMDFDGDCKSDVLWRNGATGEDYLWLMNGLTIASGGYITKISDPAWQMQGVGDFDGDGKADILWRNALTGENYIWLMNGLTIAAQGSINFLPDPAWQIQGVGDFDGDGRADILWRNLSTGENYIWLMNGWTIAAQGSINFLPDQAWQVKGIGDFDADGKADILWRNASTGENRIWLMNGLTIAAQGSINFLPDQAWQVKGIGDFDADGKADILWRNASTGENYIWLMNGWAIASQGSVNFVDPTSGWQVKGIGDFDGDGRADIFWLNTATGETYAYFMNGWAIASQGNLDTVSDPYWMPKSATTLADSTGPDTIAPSTPTRLTASAVSSSRINLSWKAATDNVGVIRYGVYRDGVQIAYIPGTSYANTGLAAATTYSYTVAAYDAAGNASAQSSAVSASTKAPADTQPPSIPTNLAATVVSSSQIDLSWSPSTDNVGVTGYRVYRNGTLVASPTGTSVSIIGLSASTAYSFTVSAVDAAGHVSAPSAPLSATTTAPADTTAPTTPTALAASAVTPTSLTLSWIAATDNVGVTGYRVYRDGTLVASPGGTSVSITGLSASTTYSFTVSAFDAAGNVSTPSAPLSVTTAAPADTTAPTTATGLVASAVTSTSLTLSWSAATDNVGVTGYRVYRDGTLVASPAGTSVSITGLSASTTYSFTVSAFDAAGNVSTPSAPLSVTTTAPADTTAPTTPTALAASAVTSSSLTLSWSASTDNVGVTGYRVYRDGTLVASPGGTSVSITGLSASTTYSFTVSAFDAAGNVSTPSAPLSVTTLTPPDTTAPSTPTGLAASAVTSTSLTLSWSAATDNVGVTGYRVYCNGTLVVSPSSTSVQITELLPGGTCAFTVSAFDAAGNVSVPSSPLSVTTPLPLLDTTAPTTPTGLAASAVTSSSLTLSWSASTDNVGVAGYRVYRDGTLVASPGGTSTSITGLSASTLYSFTVSAFDAAGNVSALSAPLSVTTPVSALPQILWSAGMETGGLGEWSEKVNSGSADTTVVSAASVGIPPKGGSYVMKQAVTGASGGTRMQRYPEVDSSARSGTTFYWSWWDYFPSTITFGISDTFILWGLNSKSTSASAGDPFWGLVFHNTGNKLDLIWSPNDTAPAQGPHAGESGKRIYSSSTPIPVGQWVLFEVMVTPSGDFTGALKIWMNGQVLFDESLVKTMYPNVGQTGVMLWIEQCGYGSGLTPTPAIHYVDDVTISLGRMPYAP